MKDYHSILGVSRNASIQDIKSAYRKLSKKFHPDFNQGDKFFEERFRELTEAYEYLTSEKPIYSRSDSKSNINSKPILNYFFSDKLNYETGEVATFEWEVKNANSVLISLFGQVPPKGRRSIVLKNPEKNLPVVLDAFSDKYSVSKTITVQVETKYNSWEKALITVDRVIGIIIIFIFIIGFLFAYVSRIDSNNQMSEMLRKVHEEVWDKEKQEFKETLPLCDCSDYSSLFRVPGGQSDSLVSEIKDYQGFGSLKGLDERGFLYVLKSSYQENELDKIFLDSLSVGMGYSSFDKIHQDSIIDRYILGNPSGNMGMGRNHKSKFVKDNFRSSAYNKAFFIKAKNGCHVFFLKENGSHFYICQESFG